jgi:hypothetical protein
VRALIINVLLNPFLLLSLGFVPTTVGASLVANFPTTLSRISRFEQLRPADVVAPGEPAFVEGRVSNHTPTVYRQFVAYLREEYRSSGRSSRWVEVARETPPLLIEAHGRVARIVNSNYTLEMTHVSTEEKPSTFTKGAVQSRGFVVGSPVLAVGSVTEATEGLVAEFLSTGTRAEYIAYLHRDSQNTLWWGGGILLGGIGCIVLGGCRLILICHSGDSKKIRRCEKY